MSHERNNTHNNNAKYYCAVKDNRMLQILVLSSTSDAGITVYLDRTETIHLIDHLNFLLEHQIDEL